ncbi:aspartic peptidase domain-containing protein [Xylariaceae sp. FL1019]|nr:aspartic peptidase domain-containing protein [Xylariaceae sp. FL1019]
MRASLSLIAVAGIASCAVAQRVLPVSISKPHARGKTAVNTFSKRASNFTQVIDNEISAGGYYATVSVGTPAQEVTLILDTGSSDVWILDNDADLCQSERLQAYYGDCLTTYDHTASSTYEVVDADGFDISYVDGSGSSGDYIADTFRIAGATIKALQMGLAAESTISSGLIGVGFDTNVAAERVYSNLIDEFMAQDVIATKSYSLYLNDLESSTGTILFGGIDTKKFIGDLKVVDIRPETISGQQIYSSFSVTLTDLEVTDGDNSNKSYVTQDIDVVLDSGTTLTYLPSTVAERVFAAFNAYDDSQGTGLVYINCDYLADKPDMTFDFRFGASGPLIRVPIDEMILDNVKAYVELGLQLPDLDFDNVCSLGLQALDDYYLLGDTFLRSAYVVYDISSLSIGMAQANLNSTESNIVEIGTSGIPSATGVNAQTTNADSSSGTDGTSTGNPTVTATTDPSDTGSAGLRTIPPPSWEAASLTLVVTIFGLAGAAIFTW